MSDVLEPLIARGQQWKCRTCTQRSSVGLIAVCELRGMRHVSGKHLPKDETKREDVRAVAQTHSVCSAQIGSRGCGRVPVLTVRALQRFGWAPLPDRT